MNTSSHRLLWVRPVASNGIPTAYGGPKALANLVSDSIQETLTDLLGTRIRETIFDYLERNYSITRNEMPDHLDQLFGLLERNFGVPARRVIGRAIAKKVYSKLDWQFQPIPSFEFVDYLEKIKARLADELLDRARLATKSI